MTAAHPRRCACKTKCGDVAPVNDHPFAVCKGLPLPTPEPLVRIVMVPR